MSIVAALKNSYSARIDFDSVTTSNPSNSNAFPARIHSPADMSRCRSSHLKKDARCAKFLAKIKLFRAFFKRPLYTQQTGRGLARKYVCFRALARGASYSDVARKSY
jgi:hypothetical protein